MVRDYKKKPFKNCAYQISTFETYENSSFTTRITYNTFNYSDTCKSTMKTICLLYIINWLQFFFLKAILIFTWVDFDPTKYGDYTFPIWAEVIGIMITFCSILAIPVVAFYKVMKNLGKESLLKVSGVCYTVMRVLKIFFQ